MELAEWPSQETLEDLTDDELYELGEALVEERRQRGLLGEPSLIDLGVPWLWLPLRRRDGSVRAKAKLDDGDVLRLGRYKWHVSGQYAWTKEPALRITRSSAGLHRVVMGLHPGDNLQVDHVNHDGLDNRRTNLRITDAGGNSQNKLKPGGRGVYFDNNQRGWVAIHQLGRKQHRIGLYDRRIDAEAAAALWRKDNMPLATDVNPPIGGDPSNRRQRSSMPKGEARADSKLTEESVREIRRRHAGGGVTMRSLSHEFGVSDVLIGQIVRRKAWTHVT